MSTPLVDDRRRIAVKFLTLGLLIGLFCAPRAGAETLKRCVASLQDVIGDIGGNEFSEPA